MTLLGRPTLSKTMVWARVDKDIRDMMRKLADAKGISMSEYVRSLIITDLDNRTVFTSVLKAEKKEVIPDE